MYTWYSVIVICNQIVAHFYIAKNGSFEVLSLHCRRCSAARRHGVLLNEADSRSFSQALELGDVLLPLQLSVTVLVL